MIARSTPVGIARKGSGMQPAKITTEAGVAQWVCPNCDQKLAEIVGRRVVIRAGKIQVSVCVDHEPEQTCFRCGAVSSLSVIVAA